MQVYRLPFITVVCQGKQVSGSIKMILPLYCSLQGSTSLNWPHIFPKPGGFFFTSFKLYQQNFPSKTNEGLLWFSTCSPSIRLWWSERGNWSLINIEKYLSSSKVIACFLQKKNEDTVKSHVLKHHPKRNKKEPCLKQFIKKKFTF